MIVQASECLYFISNIKRSNTSKYSIQEVFGSEKGRSEGNRIFTCVSEKYLQSNCKSWMLSRSANSSLSLFSPPISLPRSLFSPYLSPATRTSRAPPSLTRAALPPSLSLSAEGQQTSFPHLPPKPISSRPPLRSPPRRRPPPPLPSWAPPLPELLDPASLSPKSADSAIPGPDRALLPPDPWARRHALPWPRCRTRAAAVESKIDTMELEFFQAKPPVPPSIIHSLVMLMIVNLL